MRKEKVSKTNKKKNKKFNVKKYLRDFLLFIKKHLNKKIKILMLIAILLVAMSLKPSVDYVITQECKGACTDGMTIMGEYWSKVKLMTITGVAGVVPYVYVPVLGFLWSIVEEVASFSYAIKGYGYILGVLLGIAPLLLNILIICIVTALGMYICSTLTTGYRISNLRNMNFINFRIKVYEVLQKEKKIQALTKARDEKIEKLENKKRKINYLQILNTTILVVILQFISVVIQQVLI